jgi:hypothetical protein
MIGRIQLTALVIEDVVASCEQATLWVQSDGYWHVELDATNTSALSGNQRKHVTLLTTHGDELAGEVRIGPRRLFPFNRTVILEGVHPLERLDTAAIA